MTTPEVTINNEHVEATATALSTEHQTENIATETHGETISETPKHEAPLYAESILHIGSFSVTNSLLNSWLTVLIIIVVSLSLGRKIKKIPGKIQGYAEVILEGALNLADSVTHSRKKSMAFMPLVFSLFIFILINNWLGIFPGIGSIGFMEMHGGHPTFIPFFRGGTADLNMTLALAIIAVIATHVFGVIMTSAWAHINRFIGFDLIFELPRKVFKEKEYTAILVNPIKFFVGLVEIIGEFAKVASLSFRLFGNVFAGEVLLGAMAAIFAYALPIPFMFLEIIVGMIQALIFAMLTLVFLTVMTTSHAEEEAHN